MLGAPLPLGNFLYTIMPKYTFETSSAHATRLVNALCGLHNYQDKIDGDLEGQIDNPEPKANFTKRMIKEYLISQVKRWEQAEAKKAIETSDITITTT